TGRNWHFECIPLRVTCDWTDNRQAGLLVVSSRRENDCGPASCLLAARLRREVEPDQISSLGHVFAGYHSSFPAGAPQSVSPCRFAALIPRMSWLSFCLPFFLRIRKVPESSTAISRWSPRRSLAASAMALGIRTAMLLPHFASCVFTARGSLWIHSIYEFGFRIRSCKVCGGGPRDFTPVRRA